MPDRLSIGGWSCFKDYRCSVRSGDSEREGEIVCVGSVYLGCYGSDEGFVKCASLVEVHHSVGACFTAESSLVASDMSPLQLRVPAFGVVDDSENIADSDEADIVYAA